MQLNNKKQLKPLKRGKSEEEKKVIDYFLATGLFGTSIMSGAMSDEEYDAMLKKRLNSLNLKAKALQKIGLDEDQLKEIPPVFFYGYEDKINGGAAYGKLGKDGIYRTSAYSATYLFFSNTQMYMYNMIFDMASGAKKENTEEYFYKDITNFSTTSETMEYMEYSGCMGKATKKQIEISKFALIVPGDKFYCSTSGVKDADSAVNAMKQKLREKKG
ncbi:MAG: hypothetical protein IJR66_02385 [Clostridia bacterium]|nr:hypothetical protein [Clostridia bacterium]